MKILAVNGSPRGAKGNTDRILQPFLEGAREAGAETETVYLKDKEINYCWVDAVQQSSSRPHDRRLSHEALLRIVGMRNTAPGMAAR